MGRALVPWDYVAVSAERWQLPAQIAGMWKHSLERLFSLHDFGKDRGNEARCRWTTAEEKKLKKNYKPIFSCFCESFFWGEKCYHILLHFTEEESSPRKWKIPVRPVLSSGLWELQALQVCTYVLCAANASMLVQYQVHSSALHWCSLPQRFENNRGPSHTSKELYGSVWCSLHLLCV